MKTFILRMEGVDFDATLFDTHNLSAFRGGSLALLGAPKFVREFLGDRVKEKIFEGASQGAWIVKAADAAEAEKLRADVRAHLNAGGAEKSAEAVYPHLAFVVDIAEGEDYAALMRAEAKNRARQLQRANWTPPKFEEGAAGFNELDRMRPAPPDCVIDDVNASGGRPVSRSFKARFDYGKKQRQEFYEMEAGATKARNLDFARSFEDIVDEAPRGLPPSVSGKIAVFYADGNGFSRIRARANTIEGVRDFSHRLRDYQRVLLGDILDWLREGARGDNWEAYLQFPRSMGKQQEWPLRFETLLWGGDELTFVMPAWLGIEFSEKFFEWVEDWTAPKDKNGQEPPLTFGAGLVFCHGKTPIRQARKMAELIADAGKDTLKGDRRNILQIEAFESIAMPEHDGGLQAYRDARFDLDTRSPDADQTRKAHAKWLTLDPKSIRTVKEIKSRGELPRAQLYRLLRIARREKAFGSEGKARAALLFEADLYLKRTGVRDEDKRMDRLEAWQILSPAPLAYSLAVIADLWDYVDPLTANETLKEPAE